MAGFDLPSRAIREQIASALNLIIQIERAPRRLATHQPPHRSGRDGRRGRHAPGHLPVRLPGDGAGPDRGSPRVRRATPPQRCRRRWRAASTTPVCGSDEAGTAVPRSRCLLAALAAVPLGAGAHAQTPQDSLEVILAIDTSESMEPVIRAAKAAANEFVALMPEGVRIGVETFADLRHRVDATDHRPRPDQREDRVDRDGWRHRVVRRRGRRQPALHADGRATRSSCCCRTARTKAAPPPWTTPSHRSTACESRRSA